MLSETYVKKFEEKLEYVKTASPANKFIGFLRPFGNMKKYESFAKAMKKQQPWMEHAGVNASNALQNLEDYHPIRSIVQRFGKLNAGNAAKQGKIYAQDFQKMYPEQFAAAQKKLSTGKLFKGVALGSAGTLAGGAYLSSKKSKENNQYNY